MSYSGRCDDCLAPYQGEAPERCGWCGVIINYGLHIAATPDFKPNAELGRAADYFAASWTRMVFIAALSADGGTENVAQQLLNACSGLAEVTWHASATQTATHEMGRA